MGQEVAANPIDPDGQRRSPADQQEQHEPAAAPPGIGKAAQDEHDGEQDRGIDPQRAPWAQCFDRQGREHAAGEHKRCAAHDQPAQVRGQCLGFEECDHEHETRGGHSAEAQAVDRDFGRRVEICRDMDEAGADHSLDQHQPDHDDMPQHEGPAQHEVEPEIEKQRHDQHAADHGHGDDHADVPAGPLGRAVKPCLAGNGLVPGPVNARCDQTGTSRGLRQRQDHHRPGNKMADCRGSEASHPHGATFVDDPDRDSRKRRGMGDKALRARLHGIGEAVEQEQARRPDVIFGIPADPAIRGTAQGVVRFAGICRSVAGLARRDRRGGRRHAEQAGKQRHQPEQHNLAPNPVHDAGSSERGLEPG